MAQEEILKLVIAYTLVGALVFTVIITCLSLIGWVKFASKGQQRTLFSVLIVQLVSGSLGVFFGFLKLDPATVKHQIVTHGIEEYKIQRTNLEITQLPNKETVQAQFKSLTDPQILKLAKIIS